jgi:hypothetical protein
MTLTLTKARPEAATRAGGPSETLPEKLSPARARLTKVLLEYERAVEDLEEFQGRVARAQADQDMALDSKSLSEQEVMNRVSAAQLARSAYQSRAANREIACKLLLQQLEEATAAAQSELTGAAAGEYARRQAVIAGRLLQAIQSVDSELLARGYLDEVLDFSKPLRAIRDLEVSGFLRIEGNAAHTVGTARRILENFGKLTAAMEERI